MRKLYILLFAFLPMIASAQFSYYFTGDSTKVDALGTDVAYDLVVKNLDTTHPINLRWRIISNSFVSSEWKDYVCDEICYTPIIRYNDIVLNPDTAFPIIHHVRMKNDHGTGTSTLCFFDVADSANTIQCKTVTAISDTTVGITKIKKEASLGQNTPNPFSHTAVISYELSGSAGYLKIHDLTGKLVSDIYLNNSKGQVTVGDKLDAGLYFYSLWEDGKMVASRRMQVIE